MFAIGTLGFECLGGAWGEHERLVALVVELSVVTPGQTRGRGVARVATEEIYVGFKTISSTGWNHFEFPVFTITACHFSPAAALGHST